MTLEIEEVERIETTTEVKNIRELTSFEERQKQFILHKYPMLDDLIVDTIVRMNEDQKNDIVVKMKSGELKHEEPKDPADYIVKSVLIN